MLHKRQICLWIHRMLLSPHRFCLFLCRILVCFLLCNATATGDTFIVRLTVRTSLIDHNCCLILPWRSFIDSCNVLSWPSHKITGWLGSSWSNLSDLVIMPLLKLLRHANIWQFLVWLLLVQVSYIGETATLGHRHVLLLHLFVHCGRSIDRCSTDLVTKFYNKKKRRYK